MAKKLVKNYVFSPGLGIGDNEYPNAYSLISQNKVFLQSEITAFITNQVADATKCERDLGYLIDGVGFDVALGTNYNAIFLGLAEYNSLENSPTVLRTIARARDQVLALPNVAVDSTAVSRTTAFFNEVIDIAQNGRTAANALVFPTPTGLTGGRVNAKNRLVANRTFMAKEINAWVHVNYPAHDHDEAKCERDVKYAIDALCYDILYGGNSATYDQAKFFWYGFAGGGPGIDPTHRLQTVAAYNRLQTVVQEVVLGTAVTLSITDPGDPRYPGVQDTSGTSATSTESNALSTLVQLTEDVVNQTSQANANAFLSGVVRTAPSITWASGGLQTAKSTIDTNKTTVINTVNGFKDYIFSESKCQRDSGYVIDALLFDLRYGGNEETRRVSTFYWVGDVPQIDGSRLAEVEAYLFTADLINNFIIDNIEDQNPEQGTAQQIIDLTKTGETAAKARVSALLQDLADVIEFGLSVLPAQVIGLGRVELLDKIGLEDILIITNVTTNQVIYNFAEPTKGGQARFESGNSLAYPTAQSVSNGTTVINFNFDTSSMSSTDTIQVFLEESELRVRPYDFGTDAIERMRVAQPRAMIDADFEYGLQPTKWQAIGTQRGYPSTYETGASDILVTSVTTDASSGTSGVGSSLITCNTVSAHLLAVGQPFTIRALSSSVLGFARAEGTFLVNSVPTSTSFTYYAKSKVGTTPGEVLATTNTQLREARFYTGASLPSPTITVASNGASGTITSALLIPSGSTTIAYNGTAPGLGVPLTASGIPTGTQVAGQFGSGGSVGSFYLAAGVSPGASAIDLTDVTGIEAGMALSDGGVGNLQLVISSVVGNTLNLSGTIDTTYRGDDENYSTIILSSANFINGVGTGATFNVTATGTSYTSITLNATGINYQQGDLVDIDGALLGGSTGVNDIRLLVTGVSSGAITTFVRVNSLPAAGSGTYTGVASDGSVGNLFGNNATITIRRNAGSYSIVSIDDDGTSGYYLYNRYRILGTDLGGLSPANDAIVQITSTDSGAPQTSGQVTGVSVTGTAIRGQQVTVLSTVTLTAPTTSSIASSTSITFSAIATIQIAFGSNHGLVPGSAIIVSISTSGTNHQLAAGPFSVERVINATTIRYTARAAGSIAAGLSGAVYMRPDTYFTHRPYDGGVQLSTGGPQHGGQAIRQSKKYIRYQSGKGAMYNTGALFAPSFDLNSLTASGTEEGSFITVTTDDVDHGVQAGSVIRISGVNTVGYNGEYTVQTIIDERSFRIVALQALASATAELSFQAQMALVNWKGAVVRSGPFDDQNGIFFQYDGNELSVGRRSATFQLTGTIAMNAGANTVTGTNTRFRDQLQVGDRIVIKGMTHVVSSVDSQTSMSVTPDFRGATNISFAKICKVQDIIVPQSEWNLDRCDGTGPSGYDIDVTKMQMIGIQFSWYGAGFIDWMFRGPNGNYTFCHRLKGNNLNTEAYMRTGNLPVRYEVLNEGARSRLKGTLSSSATSMVLESSLDFPESGIVYVDNELISYTGKNDATGTLTGLTRAATLSNFAAGATRSYTGGVAATHTDNTGVIFIQCTTSPIISHWGSAYLIDGNFDEDRGFIFNFQQVAAAITPIKSTLFLIRLAPSVSNAVTGDLGERELINRAQLLLQGLEVTPTGSNINGVVIEGILNPRNYPEDPANITWNSLNSSAFGGQPSFAQIAYGNTVTWNTFGAVSSVTASTATQNNFNRSTLTFTAASVANVVVGMVISGTNIGTGRVVRSISVGSPNTVIQLNTFTQNNVNAGESITFTLPTFAQPGQAVFSFVAANNQKGELNLNGLNELTNTTIGGRGTFPNGPDVLAVNAYIASGTGTTGAVDLVLRWGEAQA